MQNKKVELLAPAGNKEAFYGAVHAGADAIYLGGSRFGARAYADNFTEEELVSCIRYAHIFGRRVYLTVNTLVKESEFGDIYDYLKPFYEAGLDGVIVQDIGVFSYIREQFPDMELHVSTQMTVTGKYGAALLKEMGACRIVPARELSLSEIIAMKKESAMLTGDELEIETFIHGAMCYCYSGQCLFSSILGGRSGNRGRCAQPCRLPYTVKTATNTSKECYPLSLKDMCTIEQIPALIEAGIDSFKIEGRMKKPEYAAGVTAIYRKYIDKYYATQGKNFKVSASDLNKLSKLYIRSERQNGYYFKHNGKDMVTLDSPAYSGNDEALLADIRERYLDKSPKLSVSVYGYFQIGEEASVTYIYKDLSVTVSGDVVQPASKQPISLENIEKQLGKLGESVFIAEDIDITLSEQAFYSLKALNELRRNAVAQMEALIIREHGLPVCRLAKDSIDIAGTENAKGDKSTAACNSAEKQKNVRGLHISVQTAKQLTAITKSAFEPKIDRIYVNGDLLKPDDDSVIELLEKLNSSEIVIALPYILRKKDEAYLEKLLRLAEKRSDIFKGFRVSSLEAMGFLKAKRYNGHIYTDAGFYIWNQHTLKEWSESVNGFCIPLELKQSEQKNLSQKNVSCEKIFYGRIPMMITANCVAKTTDCCKMGSGESVVQITDRYHKNFPVVLNCQHCINIIYNSVPLSLHGEWSKWKQQTDMRLDFTVENEKETLEILDFFGSIYVEEQNADKNSVPYNEYTTGHEKRGVE